MTKGWTATFLFGFAACMGVASHALAEQPREPSPTHGSNENAAPPSVDAGGTEPGVNAEAGNVADDDSSATDATDATEPSGSTSKDADLVLHSGETAESVSQVKPTESRVDAHDELTVVNGGDVAPLRYELERIQVRGNLRTWESVVLRYVKRSPGDVVAVDDPEWKLVQFRLLGTGLFQRVNLSLRKGSQHGKVVLVIDVVERNTIVVSDLWMGLSADADTQGNARPLTAYAGADVAETNLAGSGITVGAGMGFAQEQLALRARFFDPSAFKSQWMTNATLHYINALEFYGNRDVLYDDRFNATAKVVDYAVARYRRVGGTLGVGRDLSAAWQAWLDYWFDRVDATLPLAASHRRGLDVEPIEFGLHRGVSVLSAVRATLLYDTRDSPILPTRGELTSISVEVAEPSIGSDYPFQKLTLAASKWFTLPWKHVVCVGVFGGAIAGEAPIFERFYVGDFTDLLPSRMLGLNVDRRPPPNFLKTSIVEVRYGNYAGKVFGEYRIPLYRGSSSVYGIDFFGSAGVYGVASERDIKDPPRGYSGVSRIPVDLTFNTGIQIDTSAGGFTFAFSSVLGFIPVRSEARP